MPAPRAIPVLLDTKLSYIPIKLCHVFSYIDHVDDVVMFPL